MTDLRSRETSTTNSTHTTDPSTEPVAHATGGPADSAETAPHKSLIRRILDWLTAGYPSGVPPTERYALIALLKRTLSDDDIRQIIARLTAENSTALADGVITDEEIREMTARVLEQPPSDEDINKVSARLAAAGWPLQGHFTTGSDSEP